MANDYIGRVQVDGGAILPVGSTLYGVCNTPDDTAAKIIQESDATLGAYFKTLSSAGVTVHIKFTYGNSIAPGNSNNLLTLKVGSTNAKPIINPGGSCIWPAGTVISFTYDGTNWAVNDGITTTIPIQNTYSSSSTDAISGQGVAAALETLDGTITGTPGTGKTLSAFSETDGIVTATFQDIAITNTQVSGLGQAAVKDVDTSISANATSTNVPTTAAVVAYLGTATQGLTGAMHFKGEVQSLPDATAQATFESFESGDVVLYDDKEYVYVKKATAAASEWVELGDESSYVLKTSVTNGSVGSASGWSAGTVPTLGAEISADDITSWSQGTLPTLGDNIAADNITNWSAGDTPTFTVSSGVLQITTGSAPSLSYTPKSIPNVTGVGTLPTLEYTAKSIPNVTSVGTAPTLTVTDTGVVVPNS